LAKASFNARAGHYSLLPPGFATIGTVFGYTSPAARELFKPSSDAASRLVSIKKQFFDLD